MVLKIAVSSSNVEIIRFGSVGKFEVWVIKCRSKDATFRNSSLDVVIARCVAFIFHPIFAFEEEKITNSHAAVLEATSLL